MPSILHIDPLTFAGYPPAIKERMIWMLHAHIRAGWAGKPEVMRANA